MDSSRRRFLAGSVAGGVALVVSGAGAARADATPPTGTASRNGALATVVHDAEADGGRVAVRLSTPSPAPPASTSAEIHDAVRHVHAVGFPAGWRLRSGDLVYVDLDRDEASPHVRSAGGGWVAVNEDPQRERTIATAHRR